MNITRCSIISRRRVERDNGERCFFWGLYLRKKNASVQKKEKKHHMPDMCRAYDAYEAYEVWKRFFREDGGRERLSTHGVRTPSTACELLPPSADGPPPSKREVWGLRRSRPSALPSIAYRGFAVAPITLRASARNLVYNPGCRVATLLVSKGVMGFLGDLRGKNRNFP